MKFDISVALTWILYLALFPMAFFWLRRAWRIIVRRNYAEVALKAGEPPPDPKRFAAAEATINLVAGCVAVVLIVGVALGEFRYETWTAVAGSTIWLKVFANFILGRHAHAARAARGR